MAVIVLTTPDYVLVSTAQHGQAPTPPSAALATEIRDLWANLKHLLDEGAWAIRYPNWRYNAERAAGLRQALKAIQARRDLAEVAPKSIVPPIPGKPQPQAQAQAPAVQAERITVRERGPLMAQMRRGGVPDDSKSRSAFYYWMTYGQAGVTPVPEGTLTNELTKEQAIWMTQQMSALDNNALIELVGDFIKAGAW